MTEREFVDHLKGRFGGKDYVLIPQVRNATGFPGRVRTADALAVSLWPSRGIDAHGFEFKDSRADWLKELKQPEKSEEIGRYCAFWWLVVSDPKVFGPDELPAGWGAIHAADGGTTVLKKAPRRDALAPTWTFLAAVLKAAADVVTGEGVIQSRIAAAVAKADAGRWEAIEAAEKRGRERGGRELAELEKKVTEFEAASGVTFRRGWERAGQIGAAVRFVLDGGVERLTGDLRRIVETCDRVKAAAVGAMEAAGA